MQLENIFLHIFQKSCDQQVEGPSSGINSCILELDLRFNVVMFGVMRLETIKTGIENIINFSLAALVNQQQLPLPDDLSNSGRKSFQIQPNHQKSLMTLAVDGEIVLSVRL